MKIHDAYTIYNNGIQSIDFQLSEAINCILDHQNSQLEKLDQVELAEFKARIQTDAIDEYYSALLKKLNRHIDNMRAALEQAQKERDLGRDRIMEVNRLIQSELEDA